MKGLAALLVMNECKIQGIKPSPRDIELCATKVVEQISKEDIIEQAFYLLWSDVQALKSHAKSA